VRAEPGANLWVTLPGTGSRHPGRDDGVGCRDDGLAAGTTGWLPGRRIGTPDMQSLFFSLPRSGVGVSSGRSAWGGVGALAGKNVSKLPQCFRRW
jgi:hypothetical protein